MWSIIGWKEAAAGARMERIRDSFYGEEARQVVGTDDKENREEKNRLMIVIIAETIDGR